MIIKHQFWVGEVEASGNAELVDWEADGEHEDMSRLKIRIITSISSIVTNLEVAGKESETEKAGSRCEEAESVEALAQVGHTAHCTRAQEIKEFSGDGEEQHAQGRQHRQEAIVDDTKSKCFPDEEADVDDNEVVAKGRAEMGDPERMNSWRGEHCQPRNL